MVTYFVKLELGYVFIKIECLLTGHVFPHAQNSMFRLYVQTDVNVNVKIMATLSGSIITRIVANIFTRVHYIYHFLFCSLVCDQLMIPTTQKMQLYPTMFNQIRPYVAVKYIGYTEILSTLYKPDYEFVFHHKFCFP